MFQPNTTFHNDNQPFSLLLSNEDNAKKLKDLLLNLSKQEQNKQFKTALRNCADQVRIIAFGHNRQTTKNKILTLLKDFYCCEIVDFIEETKIDEKEIKAALSELLSEKRIQLGKRPRHQEMGKHYNDLYYLN